MPTCPFEVVAETENEAMQVAGTHAETAYKMKMTPELVANVKKIIKKV